MKLGSQCKPFFITYYSAGLVSTDLRQTGADFSQALLGGWDEFAALYPTIVKRNPRLELRDIMQDLSERYESASWPAT